MAEDQDKTEQPTPHRLRDAREKGQVARSAELTGVICLCVFCIALIASLGSVAVAAANAVRASIALAGAAPHLGSGYMRWLGGVFAPLWHALMPAVFGLLVASVAANMLQTGPIFSTEPLQPDWSRLNPAKGTKRMFSLRTLWDLGRLVLKLGLLIAVAWWLARTSWHALLATAAMPPRAAPAALEDTFVRVTKWLLLVLALIAVLDFIYTRKEFIRKLRMSRRELKDEHKRQEGDPAVRSKRRRLARDMLTRIQAVGHVPSADIIVTNPTHVAVALQYRAARMHAPVVLAKGSGWMAGRMRKLATRHGVPIRRSPVLARALFKACAIDAAIPVELYAEVGEIYRWVMARPGHKVHT